MDTLEIDRTGPLPRDGDGAIAIGGAGLVFLSNDDDLDRIARQANDTIYGIATSVWTRNGGTAHKLAARIHSGTV